MHNDEYINLQRNLNLKPLQIPQPNPTRWTGIYDSVDVILERWSVLEQYFNKKLESGNALNPFQNHEDADDDIFNLFDEDNVASAIQIDNRSSQEQKIYEFLIDKETKAYCQFLKCILQRIISFITTFEGDNFDYAYSYGFILSFIKYFFSNLISLSSFQTNIETRYKTYSFNQENALYLIKKPQFQKEFTQRFEDQIIINKLSRSQQTTFFEHIYNYFKRAALAIQDYIDLKNFKQFNLLNLQDKNLNDVELWMSTFHRFRYAMGNISNEEFYLEGFRFYESRV